MDEYELPELICKRCGYGSGNHKWYPRSPEKPTLCPGCGSPYWDKERIRVKKVSE